MAIKKQFKGLSLPSQKGKLNEYIDKLEAEKYNVYICNKRKFRTMPQNRYYWGVVLHVISDYSGIETEDLHEYFKNKFSLRTEFFIDRKLSVSREGKLVAEEIMGGLKEVPVSTKVMSTKDFTIYLDKITRWASERDIYIPAPNEIPEEELIKIINRGI